MTKLVDPPLTGCEKDTLLGFLAYQQQVFLRKLERPDGTLLGEEALRTRLAPSAMTLRGMAAHLWFVDDYWREEIMDGAGAPEPWASLDWTSDQDADWHWDAPIEEIISGLRASIARTHARLREADWDCLSRGATSGGERFSVRWIAVHLLEEWARHAGHADLLRENIDGQTGD